MSSPPFLMEDQTDADFFDKLVDDEFDASESNPSFANLSIEESATGFQELGEVEFTEEAEGQGQSKDLTVTCSDDLEKEILVSEESVSLVSASLDTKVESGDAVSDANVSAESTASRRLGSKSVSIKEVQWTVFNADSAQNGASGEGPYSEFFTDSGDIGVDPFSSLGNNSNALHFNSFGDSSNVDPFSSLGDNSNADPFSSLGDNSNVVPFSSLGDNSDVDYFGNLGDNVNLGLDPTHVTTKNVVTDAVTPVSSTIHDGQVCVASTEQVTNDQELDNSQYWENLYPGWRYDQNTGEWIQVEASDATTNAQVSYENNAQASGDDFVSGHKSEVSYLQQAAQSVAGTLAEGCTTGSVSTWNHLQQESSGYPSHMVLDPQYPGWYYDTIAQEWRTLESYDQALQSSTGHTEQFQSWNNANGGLSAHENDLSGTGDAKNYSPEVPSDLNRGGNSADSVGSHGQQNGTWYPEAVAKIDYAQQNRNLWQPATVAKSDYAQQNKNLWQPETVAKSNYAQANRNMWQPETVAKSDHAQQNSNTWQPGTIANRDYTQQSRDMWKPEIVANSGYAQQNMNIWQPEPAVKSDYAQNNRNMWQPDTVTKSVSMSGFTENQKSEQFYGSIDHVDSIQDQHVGFNPMGTSFMHEQTSRNHVGNDVTRFQSFVPSENSSQHFSQPIPEQSQQKLSSYDLYPSQNSGFYPSQPFQTTTQPLYGVNEGRSTAGRPPHALVTFGFGGKLVVMKECSSYVSNSSNRNQESVNSISVINIMDVVTDKNETHIGLNSDDYFHTLSQQSYPGPLVGGNAGAKEVSKWIDERITKCESNYTDYSKEELLRLLLSMLKIASQSYGRLRSPFGTDPSSKGSDRPEKAVAELFVSSRKNDDAQLSGYGAIPHCLQNMPSEAQLLATAAEVENLLVSGNRMEALQCARNGQLWGYALQLAADLGDQFYIDTTRQMAHQTLVAGSPLKTLSLLMAGQPADIFVSDNVNNTTQPSAANMSQHHAQIGPNAVLDDWRRNLAVITANRTKGDELVLLHLGDCLWKERGENIAAHMCYLLSETNFEPFSDSARLCLIGADHWKFPRTYASPEAIQRTEFYEYSTVLGNSQSVLLPFQPYKIIYAYMLAEVGRLSDSLKYCQAILKSLKANRAAEVDTWKQVLSSLEDRIRAHQQSGFGTNLVPKKLVDKFLPFIDSTIHRMMGPPPPAGDHGNHSIAPKVANSQSTMAMQSLIPSASMEPISAWASGDNRYSMPNRSASEPDFGRSPSQVGPNETSSSATQGKASNSGPPSRLGLFGSNLLQKTVGWVSRSRADRQAKLGEKNKFYYDEKLKRWVEEGAGPPAEEVAPPPPPTTAAFQNGMSDYSGRHLLNSDSSPANGVAEVKSPPVSDRTSGIPPIPPTTNQFSARGRMGVRSRYVDTFNKGTGAQTNFASPSVPNAKPGAGANAKFFIPTPTSSGEQTTDLASETTQEETSIRQDPPTFTSKELFKSPPTPSSSSSSSMQRFPSMNNLTPTWNKGMGLADNGNGSGSFSRRTASWSGSVSNAFSPPSKVNEIKPLGEQLGMSPSSYMPSPSAMNMQMNGGSIGDDLHEVEL